MRGTSEVDGHARRNWWLQGRDVVPLKALCVHAWIKSISTAVWSTCSQQSNKRKCTWYLGGPLATERLRNKPLLLARSRQAEPGEAILSSVFAPCMNELETLI
ncbi:hypothetical protein J3459_006624 [Metarhizium acridum]|nr:hypothetical protein J3459_006624 [Metarhizium acridum]